MQKLSNYIINVEMKTTFNIFNEQIILFFGETSKSEVNICTILKNKILSYFIKSNKN